MEYIRKILNGIVKNPEMVKLEETTDFEGTLITIQVAQEDMKFVVGKGGSAMLAIRTLAGIEAFRQGKKISIKLIEPI